MDLKPLCTVEDNLEFVYDKLFWAWLDMAKDHADFRVLMTKDNARILNECAGEFFGRIQGVLLDYVLFQMFRITDPKGKGKNKNITIKALLDFLDDDDKEKAKKLIEDVDEIMEPLRDLRDKVFAHYDREYQLSRAKKWHEITHGTGVGKGSAYYVEDLNEPIPSSVFPDIGPIDVHGKEYIDKIREETVKKAIYAVSEVLKYVSKKVDNTFAELYWKRDNYIDGGRAEKLVENLRMQRNQNRPDMKP